MDMGVNWPARATGVFHGTTASEYTALSDHRRQMCALIGEFRRAVVRPGGRKEAIGVLKAILPCSDAYFAVVESLLDKISAAGAEPHRTEHRRIIDELKRTLERCAACPEQSPTSDLVHALDTLVMHEATIRLRSSEGPSPSC